MLEACGGADEYSIPHSRARIDKGFEITLTDTTENLAYPSGEVTSVRVTQAVYVIQSNGKIKRKR